MNTQKIVGENVSKKKMKRAKDEFDKYEYYFRSVQSPENDVHFFSKTFEELKKRKPTSFREDFCGTHSLSCEWVKLSSKNTAIGVDLDPEPIKYGENKYYSLLKNDQKARVSILNANVLEPKLSKTDIVSASNFSYYIFKDRQLLLSYFKNALSNLNKDGMFIVDSFGGSKCQEANEEETEHDDFSYFWDQESFDPVNNHAVFHIHFQTHGFEKTEKCFTYDWRMWTIPEIREVMLEAGFKKVHVYWEQSDEDGEGNGEFKKTNIGEECEAWIAYIVGEN